MFDPFFGGGSFFSIMLIFQIWATIDCAKNSRLPGEQKAGWIALIWIVPFGTLVYLFWGRHQERKINAYPPGIMHGTPTSTSHHDQARPERPYAEGYQAQEQKSQHEQAGAPVHWRHYEEPQAVYPVMQQEPPMQQR